MHIPVQTAISHITTCLSAEIQGNIYSGAPFLTWCRIDFWPFQKCANHSNNLWTITEYSPGTLQNFLLISTVHTSSAVRNLIWYNIVLLHICLFYCHNDNSKKCCNAKIYTSATRSEDSCSMDLIRFDNFILSTTLQNQKGKQSWNLLCTPHFTQSHIHIYGLWNMLYVENTLQITKNKF